jgi:H+/Cl- antiporter ClcA/CBS domain-containing protein
MKSNRPLVRPEEFRYPSITLIGDRRIVIITGLAMCLGVAAGFIAQLVVAMIGFFTNLSFFGRLSTEFSSPAENQLGLWVLVIPVIGGIVVGFIARYGSAAIRGHGIPETMEQVLTNQSRVPPRITLLKPISAAIAIGTGGPFGAEGPIIATGGALGSLVGQLLKTTADERKTLLAAGAAAGMTAIFGSPVSAVLLAIELLLFEFRSRSFIPVALASVCAMAVRIALVGMEPVFRMTNVGMQSEGALAAYIVIGALIGLASVGVTKGAYWFEDAFEHLPFHWMWWPAVGGLAVGIIGYFFPHTLGVGYDNIIHTLSGNLTVASLLTLAIFKFLSWAIALGSGTSGGTLAPLFTIGGALGAVLGALAIYLFPEMHMDIRVAALVGMAAMFAGASRALLTSVVFAFETTLQSAGLLPLLGGCASAYLVSSMLMENTIMTEKIERRGLKVPSEYAADHLDRLLVKQFASQNVVTLNEKSTLSEVRHWISVHATGSAHQGFPVLDERSGLVGVVSRRNLFDAGKADDASIGQLVERAPAVVFDDNTLREAADLMVREKVGRLPVVMRENARTVTGIITRSDLLQAHTSRLAEESNIDQSISLSEIGWVRMLITRVNPSRNA